MCCRHSYALINLVIVNLGIEHGLDARLISQFSIVYFSSGLDELSHAYAEDVHGAARFDDHGGDVVDPKDEASRLDISFWRRAG